MPELIITKEQAQGMVWGDNDPAEFEVVAKVLKDTSRWSVHYTLIFRKAGEEQLYGANYSVGATESQDEQPFQYDAAVKCHKYKQVLKPAYEKE